MPRHWFAKGDHMYDVIVIGGGAAGVTAALRARELGADVALVERGALGGTCTNDGCVPTRVLAHTARLIRDADQYAAYGLGGGPPALDFPALLARTRDVVARIHQKKLLRAHLEEAGARVFAGVGPARFRDAHTVTLPDGATLQGERFILCVGGHPRRLPFPGADLALTHSDIWSLPRLPRSLAIVGGAATGCQLASVFAAFGARVTLLELAPRLLAQEDEAVSDALTTAFARRGIEVLAGIGGVARIERRGDGLRLVYLRDGGEQPLDAEAVVLAVGWPGNLDALDLPAAGVQDERGYVVVDDTLRTTAPHIWAAGDITGRMMLVQSANGEAALAAENALLDSGHPSRHRIVPHGGFTDPEYGSVGLTEARARAREADCLVAVVPYADLDRAVVDGRTDGFCKLIVSQANHRILGAHIVGEQAVEVLQLIAAGMAADLWVEQLAELELAYPTFTAVVGIAARQLVRALGVLPLAPQWRHLSESRAAEWERRQP
jgi:dihydrolipoamide dehydrogenase